MRRARVGARLELAAVPAGGEALDDEVLLFSESITRFLVEVAPEQADAFEAALGDVPFAVVGETTEDGRRPPATASSQARPPTMPTWRPLTAKRWANPEALQASRRGPGMASRRPTASAAASASPLAITPGTC